MKTVRFRHRKGYGVHSPFAFNFLTDVIYEHGRYYAYRELSQARRHAGKRLAVSNRLDKLMFRLANYCRPQTVIVAGANRGITDSYISLGCKKSVVKVYDMADAFFSEVADLCYVAPGEDFLGAFQRFAATTHDGSVFVAAGIHASSAARADWKKICADNRAKVTFDIYEAGIVFFNGRLNKQNYIISF